MDPIEGQGQSVPMKEPDHAHRRRIQNRHAQRRYREKARARKSSMSRSAQDGERASADKHSKVGGFSFETALAGCIIPASECALRKFDGQINPHVDSPITEETPPYTDSTKSNSRQDSNSGFLDVPTTQDPFFALDVLEQDGNGFFQNINQIVDGNLCLSKPPEDSVAGEQDTFLCRLERNDHEGSSQDEGGSLDDNKPLHENSESVKNNTGESDPANAIIRNQRLQLCGSAQQLIGRSISLYDCGVLLGIIPENPRLRHLLASAEEVFRFHLATEIP